MMDEPVRRGFNFALFASMLLGLFEYVKLYKVKSQESRVLESLYSR